MINITSLIILIIRPESESAYMAGWYMNYVGAWVLHSSWYTCTSFLLTGTGYRLCFFALGHLHISRKNLKFERFCSRLELCSHTCLVHSYLLPHIPPRRHPIGILVQSSILVFLSSMLHFLLVSFSPSNGKRDATRERRGLSKVIRPTSEGSLKTTWKKNQEFEEGCRHVGKKTSSSIDLSV